MSNGDDAAFPQLEQDWSINDQRYIYSLNGGISKREYFAAMAMQGLMHVPFSPNQDRGETSEQRRAENAVKQADALIEELNK